MAERIKLSSIAGHLPAGFGVFNLSVNSADGSYIEFSQPLYPQLDTQKVVIASNELLSAVDLKLKGRLTPVRITSDAPSVINCQKIQQIRDVARKLERSNRVMDAAQQIADMPAGMILRELVESFGEGKSFNRLINARILATLISYGHQVPICCAQMAVQTHDILIRDLGKAPGQLSSKAFDIIAQEDFRGLEGKAAAVMDLFAIRSFLHPAHKVLGPAQSSFRPMDVTVQPERRGYTAWCVRSDQIIPLRRSLSSALLARAEASLRSSIALSDPRLSDNAHEYAAIALDALGADFPDRWGDKKTVASSAQADRQLYERALCDKGLGFVMGRYPEQLFVLRQTARNVWPCGRRFIQTLFDTAAGHLRGNVRPCDKSRLVEYLANKGQGLEEHSSVDNLTVV